MKSTCRPHRKGLLARWAPFAATLLLFARSSWAGNDLVVGTAVPDDNNTLIAIGLHVPITGDDDYDGHVAVRYRKNDSCGRWQQAMELMHVNAGYSWLTPRFAGSIFNLEPNTEYEIELTATDPDGASGTTTQTIRAKTRGLPRTGPKPSAPRKYAHTSGDLTSMLSTAQQGDVIQLDANAVYTGSFSITASGTADDPIFIRGAGGSVLDGNQTCPPEKTDCTGPVLSVRGSNIYVEDLQVQNARKGIYIGAGGFNQWGNITVRTSGNVVRRVTLRGVQFGITSAADQTNTYVCDNDVEGVLTWEQGRQVYGDNNGAWANYSGVRISGTGNVICHNRIKGFGDSIRVQPDETPANRTSFISNVDIYGNDVLTGYDNGVELDYSWTNVRVFRNRFLNTWATFSFQPVYGGPAYVLHNVAVNIAKEPLKFAVNASGVLVFNNTFVTTPMSGVHGQVAALNLNQGDQYSRDYKIMNNLFFGPSGIAARTVQWYTQFTPAENAVFDYNGYYPNTAFYFGLDNPDQIHANNFPDLQLLASTIEDNGVLAASNVFANLPAAPTSYVPEVQPASADVTLNPTANVIDKAAPFANVNDFFQGASADLGALESGCPSTPIYGSRPAGMDETNEPKGCESLPATGCDGAGSIPTGQCSSQPALGCHTPQKAQLIMGRAIGSGNGNYLHFRWRYGTFPAMDFGDPTTISGYSLCIYESPPTGGSNLILSAVTPVASQKCGPTCSSTKACWRANGANWTYKSASNAPDGIYSMKLLPSSNNKSKVYVHGRSDCLDLIPSLDITNPLTVQVINRDNGKCWEAEFDPSHATSSPSRYSGKFDDRFIQ